MKKLFYLIMVCLVFVSCNDEPSLQEFFVKNQDDKQYLAVDIPSSLLTGDNSMLSADQKATLETIHKVNILGFQKKDDNMERYEKEKETVIKILGDEKYKQLMRYGGGARKAALYYLGEEDAIDEIILFGSDDNKGFGVARVTGENMDPEELILLFRSFEKGDLNIEGLPQLNDIFRD
jgi:hypothetical protein